MFKKLKKDMKGDEELAKPFIFSIAFLAAYILIMGLAAPIIASADYSENAEYENPENYLGFAGIGYDDWNATGGVGIWHTVTYNDTRNWISGLHEKPTTFSFEGPEGKYSAIGIQVVRDYKFNWIDDADRFKKLEGTDFLFLTQDKRGAWLATDEREGYVTFDDILTAKQKKAENVTYAEVGTKLWTGFRIFVKCNTSEDSFETNMSNFEFDIAISQTIIDKTLVGTSGLSIMFLLLTFQLPGLDDTLQILIAMPFWGMMAFMIMTLVSRYIPFIGGG